MCSIMFGKSAPDCDRVLPFSCRPFFASSFVADGNVESIPNEFMFLNDKVSTTVEGIQLVEAEKRQASNTTAPPQAGNQTPPGPPPPRTGPTPTGSNPSGYLGPNPTPVGPNPSGYSGPNPTLIDPNPSGYSGPNRNVYISNPPYGNPGQYDGYNPAFSFRPKFVWFELANCVDTHDSCCLWAQEGKCNAVFYWVQARCPQACGICVKGKFFDLEKFLFPHMKNLIVLNFMTIKFMKCLK